ncbi:MAG: pyridoxal phosphate-dependent aminotransferase [Alphaproteobacteria bacterium]|nr:pyridoxal phosphate-dependent aminotransferase [Alphaproteobacteria bacterium]
MVVLANRLKPLKPSPTLAVSQKARELRAQGKDIIDLGVGEPDFDTPLHIKQAAIDAITQGETKYTPVDGILPLKKAIQQKFLEDNQLQYDLDQILVSNGAKHSLFNALYASVNPGDEVIIPAPYWVSYVDMVLLCEGVPKIIECVEKNRFKMTASQLKESITSKTKWVILNSPSNPTGEVYSKEEWMSLLEVLRQNPHVLLLSDEIYEKLLFDDSAPLSPAALAPDLKERIVTINGVSKSFAMTGWRIGYCAGPKILINAMKDVQSHMTSNPCSISQHAALKALTGPKDFMKDWVKAYIERRDFMVEAINKINGLKCLASQGAFYLYVNCEGIIGETLKNDQDVSSYFLENGVACVPGSAFGLSPYIRLSYATSMDNLKIAVERLKTACGSL